MKSLKSNNHSKMTALLTVVTLAAGTLQCNQSDDSNDALTLALLALAANPCNGRSWNHPVGLGEHISPAGSNAEQPDIAMSQTGDAIATWRQNTNHILRAPFQNGSWEFPESVFVGAPSGATSEQDGHPRAAISNNGNIIIAYVYDADTIGFYHYTNGVWDYNEAHTPSFGPGNTEVSDPVVAMDANGNGTVAYEVVDTDNNQAGILRSEYGNGSWNHPDGSGDSAIGTALEEVVVASIVMNNAGQSLLTFLQRNLTLDNNVYVSIKNGTWDDPDGLFDTRNTGDNPVLLLGSAINESGDGIIVYVNGDTPDDELYISRYQSGVWSYPAAGPASINTASSYISGGDVAMDEAGNIVVVWAQVIGSDGHLFKAEYRNGQWINPSGVQDAINPEGSGVFEPRVAMDNLGNAVIAWRQSDGAKMQIFMSEYRNGAWKHPASLTDNISPDGMDAKLAPSVAMNDRCHAVILWNQSNGTDDQIFMSEF